MDEMLEKPDDPQLVDVARIIAKGEPPSWIVAGLEQCRVKLDYPISVDHSWAADKIGEMNAAVDTLLEWLPLFKTLPYGIPCPKDVDITLKALPGIKKWLPMVPKTKGRPKAANRDGCAAVILEIWKLVHGKAEPRSDKLQSACDNYWRACGGKPIGYLENWRRPIERAMSGNNYLIRTILEGLWGGTKCG
jgi:hypothetical protein